MKYIVLTKYLTSKPIQPTTEMKCSVSNKAEERTDARTVKSGKFCNADHSGKKHSTLRCWRCPQSCPFFPTYLERFDINNADVIAGVHICK